MKKIVVLVVLIFTKVCFAQPPSAGWNFGTDTYAQHDSSLILNSLSDRYGITTFQTPTQSLGTNDYIEENGVKNMLAIDGYTKAYDYNPLSTTGYGYNSVYNQPLPNVPLTKLTFMGLDGDPTKAQSVYVLTSEYNTLSSQGQASSITSLNSNVSTLQSDVVTTNNQVNSNTNNINVLGNSLNQTNAQVNNNTQNIGILATGLDNETNRATSAEAGLQNQVNTANNRIDTLSSRVDRLERVKVMADLNIRILDTKKYTVGFFDMYDGTNQRNFAFGARLTYKLGKSYEEKQLEKQLKLIQTLQQELSRLQD